MNTKLPPLLAAEGAIYDFLELCIALPDSTDFHPEFDPLFVFVVILLLVGGPIRSMSTPRDPREVVPCGSVMIALCDRAC